MLSRETNDLVTQTGPHTPAGELVRRYWQPVALAEELPVGGAPLPVRVLGEDLVLFRDDQARPGLLGIHCSHRGADLSYGRLEDGGLRCIYHGWLYDIHGRCLEQPGEPAGQAGLASERGNASDTPLLAAGPARFHEKIRHPAYPCVERSQAIFAYLGPGDPPLFPSFEFLNAAPGHVVAEKLLSECNYLQGCEGNIDSTHGAFLHRVFQDTGPGQADAGWFDRLWFDITENKETEWGIEHFWVRESSDRTHIHVNTFVMPNFAVIPRRAAGEGYNVNWHVPIDDEHHWKYIFHYRADEALDEAAERVSRMPLTPDYHPVPHKANRYLQDRSLMADAVYSGIPRKYFQAQDLCVTEGQPILDRTAEHLGTSDHAIVAARSMIVRAIKDVEEGLDPPGVVRESDRPRFQLVAWDLNVSGTVDWRTYVSSVT